MIPAYASPDRCQRREHILDCEGGKCILDECLRRGIGLALPVPQDFSTELQMHSGANACRPNPRAFSTPKVRPDQLRAFPFGVFEPLSLRWLGRRNLSFSTTQPARWLRRSCWMR